MKTPDHVIAQVLPGWLRDRIIAGIRFTEKGTANFDIDPKKVGEWSDWHVIVAAHAELQTGFWPWLDHWGVVEDPENSRQFFVSEPYGLDERNVLGLLRFCELTKCVFRVDASGEHYPGETLRIWITPMEWWWHENTPG